MRGRCSPQSPLLSNLSTARLLDPPGVKFWKTRLTLAAARLVSFHLRQVLHKNASCVLSSHARTHTQSLAPCCCPGPVEKRRTASALLPSQPNPTCLGSPVAANVVEPSDPDLDGNHCKHFPTWPVEEAAGERASGASRWGSFADCK